MESNSGIEQRDCSYIICRKIGELRRASNMTQEQLAERLGVTFQAVSKWENGLSCPDIALLPLISGIFGISIDELFGREAPDNKFSLSASDLPWDDDGKARAVLYIGKRLMTGPVEEGKRLFFEYKGGALNIESHFSIACGDVNGNVSSENGGVNCGDVGGSLSVNGDLSCGDVEGDVTVSGNIECGNVEGDVSAEGDVKCGDVEGDVSAEGHVECVDIQGDVCAASVRCHGAEGEIDTDEVDD